MFRFPDDLKYSKDHVWVKVDDAGEAFLGVTEAFLSLIGETEDIEFLVQPGAPFGDGENLARVEASKDEMELVSPFGGRVLEINTDLAGTPESLDDDPYDDGWLVRVKLAPDANLDYLMSADDYEDFVKEDLAELEDEDEPEEDDELDLEDEDED